MGGGAGAPPVLGRGFSPPPPLPWSLRPTVGCQRSRLGEPVMNRHVVLGACHLPPLPPPPPPDAPQGDQTLALRGGGGFSSRRIGCVWGGGLANGLPSPRAHFVCVDPLPMDGRTILKRALTPLVYVQNDQRVTGIILRHECWGTHRPPARKPPPPPQGASGRQ